MVKSPNAQMGFDYLRSYRLHPEGHERVRRGDARVLLQRIWNNPLVEQTHGQEHAIFVAPWVWSTGEPGTAELPLLWVPIDQDENGLSIVHERYSFIPGPAFGRLDYRFPELDEKVSALRGHCAAVGIDEIVRILLNHCELKPDNPPPGYSLAAPALFACKPTELMRRGLTTGHRLPIPTGNDHQILAARAFAGLNDQQSDLLISIRSLGQGEHQVADGPAASGKSYTICALLENEASVDSITNRLPQSIPLIAGDFRAPAAKQFDEQHVNDEFSRWIDIPISNYLVFTASSFTNNGMPSSSHYMNLLGDLKSDDFLQDGRKRWLENFNQRFPKAETVGHAVDFLLPLLKHLLSQTEKASASVNNCLADRQSADIDELSNRHKHHLTELKAASKELAELQTAAPTTFFDPSTAQQAKPSPILGRLLQRWRKRVEVVEVPATAIPSPAQQEAAKRKLTLRDKKRHHAKQIRKINSRLRSESYAVGLVEDIWGKKPAEEIDGLKWALDKLQNEIPQRNYHLAMRLREGRFIQAMGDPNQRPSRGHTSPFTTSTEWLSVLALLFDGIVVSQGDLNAALSSLSAHDELENVAGKFSRLVIEPDVTVTASIADIAPSLAGSTVFLVDRSISDQNRDNPHLIRLEASTKFCQKLSLAPPGITLPVSYGWSEAAAVRANNIALSRLMMPSDQDPSDGFLFHAPIHGQATCDNGLIRNTTEAAAISRWLTEHEPQISDFLGGSALEDAVVIATPFHGQREAIKKLTSTRHPNLRVVSQDTISFSDAKLAIFSPCVSALDRSPAGAAMKSALKSFFGNAKFSSAIFGDPRMFSTLRSEGVDLENPEALPFHAPIYPGVVISRELQTLAEHEDALQEVILRAEKRILIGSLNWHLPFSTWKRKDVSKWINQALERGVNVTLVIGLKGADEDEVRRSIDALISRPINLIIHNKGHSKVVLVDDNAKITGSFNWFGGGEFVDTSIYTRTKTADSQIQELWDSTIARYTARTGAQHLKEIGTYPLTRMGDKRRPPSRPIPKRR